MPKYFFHVEGDGSPPDIDGTDLSGDDEARREALKYAGQILGDHGRNHWNGPTWSLVVTDDTGQQLPLR